jgi:2-keto-4-pentenoate hydratase
MRVRHGDRLAAELAAALEVAERDRSPIEPLTDLRPEMTAEDAYEVQRRTVRRRMESGDNVVGWKVGLTSVAMQKLLGVEEPDYAPILSSMVVPDGGDIARGYLIQPKAEAEIAFVLGRELRGPGVTADDVLGATESVAPAIEVIDSRIKDWRITLADTIADMASSARVVLGPRVPLAGIDTSAVEVKLERNGGLVAVGKGSAAFGGPARAVAWAVNTLGSLGERMEAGHFVMPGALHAAVPAEPGDRFTATFDQLGSVSVRFV